MSSTPEHNVTLTFCSLTSYCSNLYIFLSLLFYIYVFYHHHSRACNQVDFSLREHTERSRAVWSTASFQLKLVNIDFYDDDDDDDGDDDDEIMIAILVMR